MYLTTRFPAPTLNHWHREMDRLFEDFFGRGPAALGEAAFPALNVWEDGDKLVAEAELPGLKLNDIEILVQGRDLTIKGRRETTKSDDVTYHRRERSVGEFARFLALPVEVDSERVSATFKDGVLRIEMPKAEHAKPRRISVKAS